MSDPSVADNSPGMAVARFPKGILTESDSDHQRPGKPDNRWRVCGPRRSAIRPLSIPTTMNRLQSEQARLYFPQPPNGIDAVQPSPALVDASGRVRAMVMELARPAAWEALSGVWRGVQAELDLPAPAIAVSGTDGLQLWFSLSEPIAAAQAHRFLEGLRQRFLADVDASRVRLMPAADVSTLRREGHAALVPQQAVSSGNWSAFLAPDLVPVFAETPWLDIAPNEEGQASLLRGIDVMAQPAFEAACAKLGPAPLVQGAGVVVPVAADVQGSLGLDRPQPAAAHAGDPRRFLLQVMNDDSVALALRIEAAKALLQHV